MPPDMNPFAVNNNNNNNNLDRTYFETQTKSEPKASVLPSGRAGQVRGREENRNALRRSEPFSPNSCPGSFRQLTWHSV